MAINRYAKRTPYDMGLYVPPIDALEKTLETAQKQYELNFTIANQLKQQFIESLPQDRAEANKIQDGWNKRIDETVKKYNGNYAAAGKDLRQLLFDMQRELSPGSKGHAIKSNFDTYKNWVLQHQELTKSGKVLGEDFNLAHNYYMKNYTGVGEINPETGSYNQFNPETVSEYQDPSKLIKTSFDSFKPQKYKVARDVFKNGNKETIEQEFEGVDPNRLYAGFSTALAGDPKLVASLKQRAKWMGIENPDQAVGQMLDQYAQYQAQSLAYMNQSDIQKLERDPLMLVREKARLDKKNQEELMGQMRMQWDMTAPNSAVPELKVDENSWRAMTGPAQGNTSNFNLWDFMAAASYGPVAANTYGQVTNARANANTKIDLKSAINDPTFAARSGVIMPLAQGVYEDIEREYAGKSTEFKEKKFWEQYKALHTSATAGQMQTMNVPAKARDTMTREFLSGALSGSSAAYRPGTYGQVTTLEGLGIDIEKDIFTKDGKLKPGIEIRAYAPAGFGFPKAGGILTVPGKGDIVIVDPDQERQALGDMLANITTPLFTKGNSAARPAHLGYDKNNNPIVGKPQYVIEKNSYGQRQGQIFFYDAYGNRLMKDARTPLTYDDVRDGVLPMFASSLPFGASNSALTQFEYYQRTQSSYN